MIPFVKAMVPVVDMAGRRILVSPPEGLLEMCSTKAIRVGAAATTFACLFGSDGCRNTFNSLWVCNLYSSGCVFPHWAH